jgi:hypothetical protein
MCSESARGAAAGAAGRDVVGRAVDLRPVDFRAVDFRPVRVAAADVVARFGAAAVRPAFLAVVRGRFAVPVAARRLALGGRFAVAMSRIRVEVSLARRRATAGGGDARGVERLLSHHRGGPARRRGQTAQGRVAS